MGLLASYGFHHTGIGKNLTVFLMLLVPFIFLSEKVQATHAAGAELTYRCLGGLTYEVDAIFYRDCGGTPEPGNITLTYRSQSCSYTRTALAIKVSGPNGQEITNPCATMPSSCNGGMTTGIRKWVYRAVITLPFACSDWMFSYRVCCRNCVVTTIQSPCSAGSELYVEAGLNNIAAPCNSSPVYGNSPIAFLCLGQNFNYNQGSYDLDGDSLSYELITPKTSPTGEVQWIPPATAQAPIASSTPFTINPITGDINLTPSMNQIGVMAIRVNEFRNGLWIGSTIRDMQVYTQNCLNSLPDASGINGTNNFMINACAGQQLCFDITTIDNDAQQILTVSWNNPIQGAVITQSGGPRPTVQFCWTPTLADVSRTPKAFTLVVKDDACPQNASQSFAYAIVVGHAEVDVAVTDPACFGSSTGSASVSLAPLPGYTYTWSTNPPQTGGSVTGLAPGQYTVTATSPDGCMDTAGFTISNPVSPMQATVYTAGSVSCSSPNGGVAEVSISGGFGPYTFLWSNGATNNQITGLNAGTYTVTVTDANGCTAVSSATITGTAGSINLSQGSVQMVNCYGGTDGSAEVMPSGGTAPYTYQWTNGSSSAVANSLSAGNYSVIVTDSYGCSATQQIIITQPVQPVQANPAVTSHVSCHGLNDGSASVNPAGGTSPYSVLWFNGHTGYSISNLAPGTWSFQITDARGCLVNDSVTITQPASVVEVSAVNVTHVACYGDSSGSIQLTANGGSGNYQFQWDHGAQTSSVQGLPSGVYQATITDSNGCSDTISVLIQEPASPLTINITQLTHAGCTNQGAGSVTAVASGGTGTPDYLWSNGSVQQTISNLNPGNYTITVTDINGCTSQHSVTILDQNSGVTITENRIQNVLCYNQSNGEIDIEITGGSQPFSYQWSNGAVTEDISNLSAGIYSVTVTDQNGCTSDSSFTITQPSAPLIPLITVGDIIECHGEKGELLVTVNGGTPPYSYLWSNGAASASLQNISAGNYTVTVTDAHGCNAIINQQLTEPLAPLVGTTVILEQVKCHGSASGSIDVHAAGGTSPYQYQWSNGSTQSGLTGVAAGTYTVTVTDGNGCTYSEIMTLTDPQPLQLAGTVTHVDCFDGINGSITANATGGAGQYQYSWSNGTSGSAVNNVLPGTYTVTVTDGNGCVKQSTFNVESNSSVALHMDSVKNICVGETVTLQVDSLPQTVYQWYFEGNILNGANGFSFTTPAAGHYYVTAVNTCGEFRSDTIRVDVKSIGNVSISNMQIICPPETATLVAGGGVSYLWNPATYITFTNIPDPVVSPPVTTTYSVEITNEFGCKTTLSTNVAVVCDSLVVPSGFSPNDDGVNDGYVIDGIEEYPGNKLWVYNRYGKLVYKATDYTNSWDGVSNVSGLYMGKKLPVGTYFYILDLNDRSKPRAGFIVLRR